MSSEAALQQRVRLEAARVGWLLWRNNSGMLPDRNGRPVRFGLANDGPSTPYASADLIGVGPGGLFLAVECKAPGWRGVRTEHERRQEAFLRRVCQSGGIGLFCADSSTFVAQVVTLALEVTHAR